MLEKSLNDNIGGINNDAHGRIRHPMSQKFHLMAIFAGANATEAAAVHTIGVHIHLSVRTRYISGWII